VRRLIVDPNRPDAAALDEAVRAIRGGGLIAIPTDTLYGLAVDPFQPDAVDRIFEVKGRSAERALPLIAADAEQVRERLGALTPLADRLAARFWPGPLTLLLAAPAALATNVSGGTGKVGVRVPSQEIARLLCRACGIPLTATSANVSGAAPSADPDAIVRSLGDRIDLLVDAGVTPGGLPSTIVDATGDQPVLVRAGRIAWEEVTRMSV
jgi:L-threonylcarbamoyladenylate synthase